MWPPCSPPRRTATAPTRSGWPPAGCPCLASRPASSIPCTLEDVKPGGDGRDLVPLGPGDARLPQPAGGHRGDEDRRRLDPLRRYRPRRRRRLRLRPGPGQGHDHHRRRERLRPRGRERAQRLPGRERGRDHRGPRRPLGRVRQGRRRPRSGRGVVRRRRHRLLPRPAGALPVPGLGRLSSTTCRAARRARCSSAPCASPTGPAGNGQSERWTSRVGRAICPSVRKRTGLRLAGGCGRS